MPSRLPAPRGGRPRRVGRGALRRLRRWAAGEPRPQDDVEIVEAAGRDAVALYYADEGSAAAGGDAGGEIVYSPELGLAVERPREGVTLEMLWNPL